MRAVRPCINCGQPIRWEPAECSDCRGGYLAHLARHERKTPVEKARIAHEAMRTIDYSEVEWRLIAGQHYVEIAAALGVARSTIARVAKKLGRERKRGGPKLRDDAAIVEMLAAGMSQKDIASALGVCRTSVYHARKAMEAAHA